MRLASAVAVLERRVLPVLLLWSLLLLVCHAALHLSWRLRSAPKPLRDLFAFASEDSLVTWTSVAATLCLALACWVHGVLVERRSWSFAGLFFAYLSLDDEAMLHERLSWLSGVADGATYAWTVVVLPLLLLGGVAVLALLLRAARGHRRARRRMLLGAGLWGAALLLELAERALIESGLRWRGFPVHRYQQALEEWCEMVAPASLLVGVLALIAAELADEGHPPAA